ncbi:GntR family transcriptional regulator [Phaeobacter sp. 22II1-1F12B]|uniref:GntR family transcriptional regulator n=1 Tax=Phaeobacter sp. 22II1-1F12B TaxID=1317111 RepID=UPI000B5289B9|nr:GntR family transcriptional regulator [Phaeobacter sp. 22II1-1F12B]
MEIIRFDTDERQGDTIGDTAYRRIRSDIVHGRLAPDEKLKLERMKEVYSASVTTLREILNRLAVEELVSAEGQRGFRVAPIDEAELHDLARMRILLESHALRESIASGDVEWEACVVAAHYKLSSVERELMEGRPAGDVNWVSFDWGFHYAMISACGQKVLMRTHSSIYDRLARYHMLALAFRGKPAVEEHERLRDLVIERKADAAVELLAKHVQSGVDCIMQSGRINAA